MRRRNLLALALAAALGGGACASGGSRQQRRGDDDELYEFRCLDRRAEYILVGGFVAAELGVIVECEGNRATLTKWALDPDSGERDAATHDLTGAEFDEIWQSFDDAGWKNLSDCQNPTARDGDQVYTFELSDGDTRVALSCPGKELPFPFDRLVNAFDLLAGQY
jgi:hypothetical protein